MIRHLPALTGRVIDSPGQTEAFLADFRRTLGELYAEVHFGNDAGLYSRTRDLDPS